MGNKECKNFKERLVETFRGASKAARDLRVVNNPGHEDPDEVKSALQESGQTRVPNNTSTGR